MGRRIASFLFALATLTLGWSFPATTQSTCRYLAPGAVLTYAQWTACFEAKQDIFGGTPIVGIITTAPIISTGTSTVTLGCALATTSTPGCAQADGTTIHVSGGIFTAVGASASSIDASGATTISNGIASGILYDNAGAVGALAATHNGVLITSGSGAPSIATTLPSGMAIPSPTITGTATMPDSSSWTSTGIVNVVSETIVGGTLSAGASALTITATQPASPSTSQQAVVINITGNGGASENNNAVLVNYLAGYTGSNETAGLAVANANAGIGSTPIPASGSNTVVGNRGLIGSASATTNGLNIGTEGHANGGNINFGLVGIAQIAKNGETNIGVVGSAINPGSGSIVQIGGWFSLNQTTLPTVSAALIADNGSQSSPVALFQVNGVTKVEIDQNGNLTAPVSSIRLRLAGTAVGQNTYGYYANGSTGNDSNPGTSGSPFQHCQYMIDYISMNVDAHAQNLQLNCVDASADTSGFIARNIVGLYDNWPTPTIELIGNTGTPVAMNAGAQYCFTAQGPSASGWRFRGFACDSSAGLVHADAGARIIIDSDSITGNPPCVLSSSYNASIIEIAGNLTDNDTGGETGGFGCFTGDGQIITAGTPNISLATSFARTNGFWLGNGPSQSLVAGITYTGAGATVPASPSSPTFVLLNNATITTGVCPNWGNQGTSSLYPPGNVAGTAPSSTGGQCQ
jgi:hypothetical protein